MRNRGKWDGTHCWHRSSQERDSLCCVHSLARVEWLSDVRLRARKKEGATHLRFDSPDSSTSPDSER